MKFKNLRISTRLTLGFSVILVIVFALSYISFKQTQSMWQNTKNLYEHPFKVNIAIREIETNIAKMHLSLKAMAIASDTTEINKYLREIDTTENEVVKEFNTIKELYLGQKSTVDSAYSAFMEWKIVRDSTILLKKSGSSKELTLHNTIHAEIFTDEILMPRVEKLKIFALNRAESFFKSSEEKKGNLQIQLIGLVLIIITLVIVAFILTMNGIKKPIKELIKASLRFQGGDYSARSVNDSTNEIGLLAESINLMAESIQSEMIIKSTISEIYEALLGKDDLRRFSETLLEVLLKKTNSNVAALYLLDDNYSLFQPYFTIGLQKERVRSFSSLSYEGEFGRTLLEKTMIRIKDIPADSAFDFVTTSCTFRPREIINIPVMQLDKCIAIISIASMSPYSNDIVEILRLSGANITSTILSILSFEKIKIISHNLNMQNIELESQSKEMKMQTDELLEQNAELEMQKKQIDEANRLKSEFLSSMSHELRTPLNSIIALTNVLNRRVKNKISEEEYSYLEVVERNGKNLLSLINDILDLSRIEAGKIDLEMSKFSLNDLIDSILSTVQPLAENKGIKTKNEIGSGFPLIISDVTKCHHIFQNLIGNAVKFTEKGSVTITSEIVNGEVHVSVEDTGIGIPQEHLPFIFEEFRQVDGSNSRKYEGTGLGLAIADKFCKLLSGRISVTSDLNRGSIFTVILPLGNTEEHFINKPGHDFRNILSKKDESGESDQTDNTGKTILIIEDSEPAIIQLTEILKEEGYKHEIARSGAEALEIVNTIKPDGIILDLMMPGMDGFQVLEEIRKAPEISKIPVLILTAKYLSNVELKRLTENNIHQLIQKGDITKSDLLNCIRRMHVGKQSGNGNPLPEKEFKKHRIDKPVVLLVEDNKDNIIAVKALIDDKYEVVVAEDGVAGLEKAISIVPDLILLDISLPMLDGYNVLKEIKRDKNLINIPVIAVTASVMKGNKEEILSHGFDDFIAKPIDNQVFNKKLEKYLN